jgi:hypothetical protein
MVKNNKPLRICGGSPVESESSFADLDEELVEDMREIATQLCKKGVSPLRALDILRQCMTDHLGSQEDAAEEARGSDADRVLH